MREASVLAQAKINLFLRVLAREASGYHQLETLFQRLELGDDVRVRVDVSGRTLDCGGADVGPVARNLAWRAAEAYHAATGWPDAWAIEIEKRIPVGGGLGGGSADAGAVLRCLNALAPQPLSAGELLALGAPLGADVPALTTEAPLTLAWGRGERMLALPPLPPRRVHLALFGEGVSTAEAYGALAARRDGELRPRPILWAPDRLARWDDVALVATNDFEAVVFPLREDVAAVRGMFDQVTRRVDALHHTDGEPARRDPATGDTAPIALMSGSGATVFLLTPLDGVEVVFEVRGPGSPDGDAAASSDDAPGDDTAVTPVDDAEDADADIDGSPRGFAIVQTRTATRVAPVSVNG
ncbi:MAG: 4-(cytidine 5'-diphospho)-2-C-methyl-D-erythritol kinase [Gemmatirosa sp.]